MFHRLYLKKSKKKLYSKINTYFSGCRTTLSVYEFSIHFHKNEKITGMLVEYLAGIEFERTVEISSSFVFLYNKIKKNIINYNNNLRYHWF